MLWLLVFSPASWKSSRLQRTQKKKHVHYVPEAETQFFGRNLTLKKKIPATDGVGVLPPITGEADPRAVVEEDTDGSIRQLEAKSVLVRVIDPLGDEERVGGHGGRIGRR